MAQKQRREGDKQPKEGKKDVRGSQETDETTKQKEEKPKDSSLRLSRHLRLSFIGERRLYTGRLMLACVRACSRLHLSAPVFACVCLCRLEDSRGYAAAIVFKRAYGF